MALDTYPVLPGLVQGHVQDVRTEMLLGSLGWTNISQWVEEISDQAAARGKPDESTSNTPGSLGLVLNNADGRFFDGNPLSPYYGNLGRNSQLRISVPEGATYLRLRDDQTSIVNGPTINFTGDFDLRMDVTLDNWRSLQLLGGQWGSSTEQTWALILLQTGQLQFLVSTTGSNQTTFTSAFPFPVPASRRQLLRVTFNHANGGVDFYYAPAQSLGGLTSASPAWVHWGTGFAIGASTLFSGTANTGFGNVGSLPQPGMTGKIHCCQLLAGTIPQHTGTNPPLLSAANGGTLTWAANPNAGSKVLIAVWTTTAETISSVKDNGTSQTTFTLDKTLTFGTRVVSIYRGDAISLPSAGSYAVTVTGSGGAIVVAGGQAYTGVATGAPINPAGGSGTSSGQATGTAVASGFATPSSNGACFFAAFADATALASETITLTGPSFSQVANAIQVNGSTSIAGAAADRLDGGGTGPAGCTWTLGDSVAWGSVIAVYPPAPGLTVASPDFTGEPAGTTSFSDAQSNTWTTQGTAQITDRHYRFWGETSAFPTAWNNRGTSVNITVQAAGILRRLTQSASQQVFQSALRRAWPKLPDLVAYWPCEDGNSQGFGFATALTPTSFAAATPGTPIGTYQGGPPSFAADSSFQASLALPTINGATWNFSIPQNHTADVGNIMRWLLDVPPAGESATLVGGSTQDVPLIDLHTTGTVARLSVCLQGGSQPITNGPISTNLEVIAYNAAGSVITSFGAAIPVQGIPMWVSAEMYQSGGNVQLALGIQIIGPLGGVVTYTGLTTPGTLGNGTQIVVDAAGTLTQTGLGQITYQRAFHDMSTGEYTSQVNAWIGETAGNRFSRLCSEQGIPFQSRGNLADTQPMGAQTTIDVMSLLQECVDADRGLWWEPPWVLALGYRTLADLLNQQPVASIPYAASAVTAGGLTSNEDDQFTVNDAIVVNTYTGGQAEVAVTTGPLSTQAPPNGVGEYGAQPQVNLQNDYQCSDEAGWITWVGTAPDLRYPAIPFPMQRQTTANFFALQEADVGDRVQVVTPPANGPAPANTSQPSWLPPASQTTYARGGIDVLVNNLATNLNVKKYEVVITGVPTTPYLCAQADDLVHGHLGAASSQLSGPVTAAQTFLPVNTPVSGIIRPTDPWTTSDSDFPFDLGVGGEQITATGCGGAVVNDVGSDSANPPQIAVTPGASGSVIYGAVLNPTSATAFTPNAATTFSQNVADATNTRAYGTFRSTSPTVAGTPVTVGGSAPAVSGHIEACEVAAAGSNFLVTAGSGSVHNSDLAGGTTGTWTNDGNATLAVGNIGHDGTNSLQMTSQASGQIAATHAPAVGAGTNALAVVPGQAVIAQAWFRPQTTVENVEMSVRFEQASGTFISYQIGPQSTEVAGQWVKATDGGQIIAPPLAAWAYVDCVVVTSKQAGEVHYAADIYFAAGVAEDPSSPAGVNTTAAKTLTTASFTPPANSLLLAMTVANGAGPGQAISDTTGTGWTRLGNDGANNVNLWCKYIGPNPVSMTVTNTWSGGGASNGGALTVKVLTGAAAGPGCQVFTVARAQNGIAKTQAAGAAVDLYTTPALSL